MLAQCGVAFFLSPHHYLRARFVAPVAIGLVFSGLLAITAPGCSDGSASSGGGSGGGTTTTTAAACPIPADPFELGDAVGHADPYGAKAAGQARAGRIVTEADIVQPAHGRQKTHVGDFVLANDRIAVTIEDKGLSDGYARFGGEILAIDAIGEDGRPMGLSYYNETLLGLSVEMVNPTSVTVLKDGSDGGEAVVRVAGVTQPIPFLEGPIGTLFPDRYGIETALDYVLMPGWDKVLLRMSVVNRGEEAIDFGLNKPTKDELFGMFHYSRSQMFTPESGFTSAKGLVDWVGFDSGPSAFAFRAPDGKLEYGVEQSGFALYWGPGFVADPCTVTTHDHVEVVYALGGIDAVAEAIRKDTSADAWRVVKGTVKDGDGAPVAGAYVHELAADGAYLSRARTGEDGSFTLHAPPKQAVSLVAQKKGYRTPSATPVAADAGAADLVFEPTATIHVKAIDPASNEALPVRIQVIPKEAPAATPDAWGVPDEVNGRIHQEFAVTGEAALTVPAGQHHVIVSRGYEYELYETDVSAGTGETVEVVAPLTRSVDTTGRMCADFHIHSWNSADSDDPVEYKVKGAIADGLDIPVSSEHEWVIDFQPIVEQLGMEKWAHGIASEELTTFAWGHFGVVPLNPKDDKVNHGAVEWIGSTPGETFDRVRSQVEDPALIVNHPRGSGFGGYFSASKYNRVTGESDAPDMWSTNFDAIEVFNDSDFEKNRDASVADWFSLLNYGHKFWAVGSSDSHHLRTSPVGYPRTCLWFGHDDPTKITGSSVRDAIRSGDSTISGGLYMTVTGPGGEHPGMDVIVDAGADAVFTVTVESPSWILGDTLETIVNGQTVSTEPLVPVGSGPSNRYEAQVTVKYGADGQPRWVLFHAKGAGDLAPLHPGRRPFAVSNPMFLSYTLQQ
ncbi:MAG: CehA/McbA family metallohydrolase [Polyangiaceae bacterium]